MPLLLHAAPLLLALLCSLLLALLCSLLLSLCAPICSSIGSLPKLCCSLLEFSPHIRGTWEKDERHFEKRNLCSHVPRLSFHEQEVLVSCQELRSAWRDTG